MDHRNFKARMAAHQYFDQLWKSGRMSREGAYKWLSVELGLPPRDCHFSQLGEDTCQRVIKKVKKLGIKKKSK